MLIHILNMNILYCRNTWRRENEGDSNPLTDFYLFFSDRSEGGKRWLIDNAIWYKDPVKRNGNEYSGKVYLQDSIFPSERNVWIISILGLLSP